MSDYEDPRSYDDEDVGYAGSVVLAIVVVVAALLAALWAAK